MTTYAFFEGKIVPLKEAKIGVMTHAFNYGTGVFEGIRGYWNEDDQQIYLFRLREHFERLANSCRIVKIKLRYSIEEMCKLCVELVRLNEHHEDCYVRPLAYKSDNLIGVRLHNLDDEFLIYTAPFGAYIDIDKGISCGVSSWRRIDDNMAPARAKITGAYINSAFAKTEAIENGFDEAIMLTQDGHVSEGSAENIFLIEEGRLVTPPPSDNILLGITRNTLIELAREEFGIETIERSIDRSELYLADELFLCGTGAQVSAVTSVDHRAVGSGEIGPITAKLQALYFDVAKGRNPKYAKWCTPAYDKSRTHA
ncbi:MAG: branched-chain amino acid transaminase [Chloroflexota bacterium]|nr:MAG: branched-chain amino acid transaminase [Chloroflexota bacterium]